MIESTQKRNKDLEKSNTSLRKELAEAKAAMDVAEKRVKEAEERAKAVEAAHKLEMEVSKLELDSFKEAVGSLKQEKVDLIDQLEGVAFKAMLKERSSLMRQYLAGEHVAWTPAEWIKECERMEAGLYSEDEGDGTVQGDVASGAAEVGDEDGKDDDIRAPPAD